MCFLQIYIFGPQTNQLNLSGIFLIVQTRTVTLQPLSLDKKYIIFWSVLLNSEEALLCLNHKNYFDMFLIFQAFIYYWREVSDYPSRSFKIIYMSSISSNVNLEFKVILVKKNGKFICQCLNIYLILLHIKINMFFCLKNIQQLIVCTFDFFFLKFSSSAGLWASLIC